MNTIDWFIVDRVPYMKILFSKPLTSTPTCYSFALVTPFAIKLFKSHKVCSYCGLISFDVLHNVYKVIKSGNKWHAGVDRRGFGIKQNFILLFFFMCVQNLWQGQKAVLTIVEFELFDIFYSKFQLVDQHFPFVVNFVFKIGFFFPVTWVANK